MHMHAFCHITKVKMLKMFSLMISDCCIGDREDYRSRYMCDEELIFHILFKYLLWTEITEFIDQGDDSTQWNKALSLFLYRSREDLLKEGRDSLLCLFHLGWAWHKYALNFAVTPHYCRMQIYEEEPYILSLLKQVASNYYQSVYYFFLLLDCNQFFFSFVFQFY